MNTLSWFLYFADVLPLLRNCLIGISFFVFFISLFLWPIAADDDFREMSPLKILGVHFIILSVLFVSVLIPSKNTFYAIAVSEMGEKALETELGKKTTRALEIWVENQLPKEAE